MAAGGLDSGGKVLRLPSGVEAEAISAVMPAGSLLGFDGAIWHAGGASAATHSRSRLALNFVYCCGWLQQQVQAPLPQPWLWRADRRGTFCRRISTLACRTPTSSPCLPGSRICLATAIR